MYKVFIDGQAGTTGLQIRQRLEQRSDIELLSIAQEQRKDARVKQDLMAQADLVVLCLPDQQALASVALLDEIERASGRPGAKVIDASTAHRCAPGWVYGFAELTAGHSAAIAQARRVANPGCYATGAIALLRPLVDAGLIPPDFPVCLPAVSGYSGGGRAMIADYESGEAPAFELYGLGLKHKHVPEIMAYSGLTRRPLLLPAVANFRQGMLVQLPLQLDMLPAKPSLDELQEALARHYAHSEWVRVPEATANNRINATKLTGTNQLELRVFGNRDAGDDFRHAVLVARLDNLGKGASGAALQNMQLMLGL